MIGKVLKHLFKQRDGRKKNVLTVKNQGSYARQHGSEGTIGFKNGAGGSSACSETRSGKKTGEKYGIGGYFLGGPTCPTAQPAPVSPTHIIRKLVPSVLLSYKMAIKLGDAGTVDHFGLAFQYQI